MNCPTREHLERVAMGEAAAAGAEEHVVLCAKCRHELRWLKSERALFRQRASRHEVDALWRRTQSRLAPAGGRRLTRLMAGLAAAVVAVLALGQSVLPGPSREPMGGPSSMSAFEPEVSTAESRAVASEPGCSRLPAGVGFHCPSPASFASR